ncbi:MAG: 4-hydroxythreonine-4-phosphate dehydrogenase PdxA [Alphaproteobacteria bacterium]|jgi:4-hydroxythreonine-4-phosphate dehydrogenase|nr:4-hydroxythreonine-4-phosphate dehydrogenase PdxA [Alphaproteobacteria bacterium]
MKKILALSAGDPNSIATFISLKAWQALRESSDVFVFIGNKNNVDAAISYFGLPIKTLALKDLADRERICELFKEYFLVFDIGGSIDFSLGKPVVANAEYILNSLHTGVDLVEKGLVDGIITNPVDKHLINEYLVNDTFVGHTEYLAKLSHANDTVMMFCSNKSALKVVPLTTHVSLSQAINSLSAELIVNKTIQINNFLKKYYGMANPRISMLSLNPHAGENGLMGDEEIKIINPAIKQLQGLGLDISGSFPADSFFTAQNMAGDIIIGMYHDQVLTPFKTLYFDSGVNTTIGLPFIRTSPDHGVGFNIAASSKANPNSLIAAIEVASSLVNHE